MIAEVLEFESLFARENELFFLINADFCFFVFDFLPLDILFVVSNPISHSFAIEKGQELEDTDVMIEASVTLTSLLFFI